MSQFTMLLCPMEDIICNNTNITEYRLVQICKQWAIYNFKRLYYLDQNSGISQTCAESHKLIQSLTDKLRFKFQEFCKIMEERSRELDLELGYKVSFDGFHLHTIFLCEGIYMKMSLTMICVLWWFWWQTVKNNNYDTFSGVLQGVQ